MMKHILTLIGVLMLAILIAACSAPPAPTAVPAQPTAAPKPTDAPKPTTAPATSAPAAKPTEPAKPTSAPAATTAPASNGNPPAASGATQTVEIRLTPTDMIPGEITVKAGAKVHFVLTNTDKTEEHNLVSAKAKLKEILVAPNATVEADWVAPTTPGDFEVPCSIHREIIPLAIHVVP